MTLTSEQQEKILNWLGSKKRQPKMSNVQQKSMGFWRNHHHKQSKRKGKTEPDQYSPAMIQIICTNCGYLRLHLIHKDLNLF